MPQVWTTVARSKEESVSDLRPNWVGEFRNFNHWVNYASGRIDKNAVCIDTKGRRCLIGRDFMRARDEGAFPVRYFWDCAPEGVAHGVAKEGQEASETLGAAGFEPATPTPPE